MIRALVDTNVVVQAAISSRGASYRVIQAGFDGRFRFAMSAETLDELYAVLNLPTIQARHGWSSQEIDDFVTLVLADSDLYVGEERVPPSLPRDISDTKFIELAHVARAEYLVTNDRRHLLRLKRYRGTAIVTPAEFLRRLPVV